MSIQPYYERDGITIFHGDCVDVLRGLDEASIDAIVTDPPYGLEFMGKEWDRLGATVEYPADGEGPWGRTNRVRYGKSAASAQEWHERWAREVLRVLKPGGHMLAFGGTRTYHRMACAIEDAGFEIRDQLQWLYGSGFPKSHAIDKAIDKMHGATRERVRPVAAPASNGNGTNALGGGWQDEPWETAPATPDAERWQGWGTALKPANEPIVLARKPLSEPTVAANVLRWGTGALNVDACRIAGVVPSTTQGQSGQQGVIYGADQRDQRLFVGNPSGRWPANVILSHSLFCTDDACDPSCAVALLDAQSGVSKSTDRPRHNGEFKSPAKGYETPHTTYGHNDSGGASRYYYVAKASRRERGEGNNHPTVKPVDLMRYLVRLITPPGGTVLDPFGGSGTTALACLAEGFECVLIEREQDYAQIAESRIARWSAN